MHEGKKPYKCKTCNAGFTNQRGVKNHAMKVHVEKKICPKKPHKCEACNKTYIHEKSLIKHISSVHEKEDKQMKTKTSLDTIYKLWCRDQMRLNIPIS